MFGRRLLLVILHCFPGAAVDPGAKVWVDLEDLARGAGNTQVLTRSYWQDQLDALHALHPHSAPWGCRVRGSTVREISAAIAWLYLFGLAGESGSSEALVDRDVDRAVEIAREGAFQSKCGRCFSLLGFLLAVGFPPLLGAAHLTEDSAGMPRLVFLGDVLSDLSIYAARLPRDIGAPDPAAAAYTIASQQGDAIGLLATSYLSQTGLIHLDTYRAPSPNRASSMISRPPHPRRGDADKNGDPRSAVRARDTDLARSLGHLASEVLQNLQNTSGRSWGALPGPLSGRSTDRSDVAFVELVLADVANARAADLARAATLLEGNPEMSQHLPEIARQHANVPELISSAAEKGDRRSALRAAVDFLQSNKTEQAKPLLEAVSQAEDSEEAMRAMAQYYLVRFVDQNESSQEEARRLAWPHLLQAADLGRQDAQLLVAHAHVSPNDFAALEDELDQNTTSAREAQRRYRQLVGGQGQGQGEQGRPKGNLSEVQTFAAYNLGVLSLHSHDGPTGPSGGHEEPRDTGGTRSEAHEMFQQVALSQSHIVRLVLALERRAAQLGDLHGALLLAMLLSDMGHVLGHMDAAHLWDQWSHLRPPHLRTLNEDEVDKEEEVHPCDLHGWWKTATADLLDQNVTTLFAARVLGGGFEMFNVSDDQTTLAHLSGLEGEMTMPRATGDFQHLHSFLWHTTHDAFPGGAPVPVALQPPGAVPHLVEFHHQRGKLSVDESCRVASVDGMYVNWTFHRLEPQRMGEKTQESISIDTEIAISLGGDESTSYLVEPNAFLHCWVRPERYYVALQAALDAPPPRPSQGTWEEEIMSLTTSNDCPCYGGFACRRGDGACEQLAKQSAGSGEELLACRPGSTFCREVPADIEPARSNFAAAPDVCGFYFYRRAAADGHLDAMHVLSHAYSNGHRGAPKDAAEAFAWSAAAAARGDLRGRFDVAYSLEFGLGTVADPERASQMYREILTDQGWDGDSMVGKAAASFLSLLASSGRYASRLLHST
ncbi:unnamed protein product [Durusdinium trenchii]|uniref:Uncharacterized protein n=1 Tax=Durusdinium trenchii TaxID=1381693 RepID=A0ABP0RQ92_9DINO